MRDNSTYCFLFFSDTPQNRRKTGQIQQPNIYALLKICATIPATSCECVTGASSSRRLHTYNRACMGQERLSSLALMHIHYQVKIVLDEVVNLFATKHPRRLDLGTINSEGLVPQYFDVSFYIVKLVLYNLIQTVVFDKCNIQFLPCTLPLQFLVYCYFPK